MTLCALRRARSANHNTQIRITNLRKRTSGSPIVGAQHTGQRASFLATGPAKSAIRAGKRESKKDPFQQVLDIPKTTKTQ